jgi:manganese/zinc/iron transport system ATP- binding protein
MRVVAAGPTDAVFTEENLKKTYGGKLTLLSQALHEYAKAPTITGKEGS